MLALAAFAVATPLQAKDELDARSRMDREVNLLLGELRASQCRFNRNGTWYDGADAAQHLAKKYDYLRSKIASTEQFIAKGGSSSSMSGKAYLVQCGDAKAVASGAWLSGHLKALRKSKRLEKEQAAFEKEREEEEEREREGRD
jgi:hypothetical protein